MTLRRSWAALAMLSGAVVLVAAAPAGPPAAAPAPHASDSGNAASTRPADGGRSAAAPDSGPLTVNDLEVIENLELLEHLPESDVLDLLVGSE